MSDDSEYIETINCLNQVFTVADKNTRTNAENRLKELDFAKHISYIFIAMKDEKKLNSDIILSSIIYMKNSIEKKIDLNFLNKNLAIQLLKNVIDIILSTNLSDICLKNFGPLMLRLLNYVEISNDAKVVYEIVTSLSEYCKNCIIDKQDYFNRILMIFESIIASESIIPSNSILIIKILLESSKLILYSTMEKMKNIDIVNNLNLLVYCYQICENVYHFLYMVNLKTQLRFRNFDKLEKIYIDTFLTPSVILISSNIPGINASSLISWTNKVEIDLKINFMKIQCFQFLQSFIKYYNNVIDENVMKIVSILIESILKDLEIVIKEKFGFLSNFEIDENYSNYGYEVLIYRMLSFLSVILTKEPVIMHFYQFSRKLLINILLPFMIITKNEIEELQQEPEKYDGYITDLLSKKKAKKIKTAACLLFTRICKKYDGLDTFILEYLFSNLDCIFREQKNDSIYIEDNFFNNYDMETKLETIFLVLAILSDYVITNKKLMNNLNIIIETHIDKIFSINSFMINARICLFFEKYLDSLFQNDKNKLSVCLNELVKFVFSNHNGLKYQAIQTLNNFVKNKEFLNIMDILVKNYCEKLIGLIPEINNTYFFDLILEIVKNYNIDAFILPLIKLVTSRILLEMKVYERKKKNQKIENDILVKCFNIISTISEKEKYVVKYLIQIEEILFPILDNMKNPKKIDFDEDIIIIVTNFIRLTKSIPKSLDYIFPYLDKYYSKADSLMLDLFELLNYTIYYGKSFAKANENNLDFLFSIFEKSLIDDRVFEKSPILGCSLINILLQTHDNIPSIYVKKIISFTHNQLIQINATDQVLKIYIITFNKYVALLGIIYSGLIKYSTVVLETLQNDLENLLEITDIILKSKFYSIYQTKIIILGICGLFTSDCLSIEALEQYFVKFINFVISLLKRQENEERSIIKNRYNNQIDVNFQKSENEEEEEEVEDYNDEFEDDEINRDKEDYNYEEEREIRDINDRMMCPSKNYDEYEIFKLTIQKIRDTQAVLFNNWINSLSIKEKEIFLKIINTQRVEINSFHQKTNLDNFTNLTMNTKCKVPRTIVKIKRNNI